MSMSPFQNNYPPRPEDAGAWRSAQASQGVLNLVLTSALVVLAFAAGWFGNSFVNRDNLATGDQRLILQAWNTIDQNYIGTIDHRKMAYAAIAAMADSLGDTGHTRFETPEEFARESKELQNSQLSGIGVQLTGGGSQPIRINAVIPDSPASKANMKAGDLIVGVGGTDVRGKTLDQVSPLIQGKAGTPVTLTLIRPSASATATFDVTIVRGNFSFPAVESYLIPGTTIAHIAVIEFTQDADTQLEKALKDAQAHHVTGIILDLRDDPGGYLDQAQSVVSEFIPAGSGKYVLIEKTRQGETKVPVASGGLATTTPLVVLVNGGTASAAEITAGAININRPSVELIGEPTFGTGTILQTFQLADGSALILGTQEWLLPNGESIYHKHLEPDQHVTLAAGAIPISPLAAQQQGLTLAQIQQSGDTQLIKGLAFLLQRSDLQFERERADYLLSHGTAQYEEFIARLEQLRRSRRNELNRYLDAIVQANEPTILPEGSFHELKEINERTYIDFEGVERPLLQDEELRFLMIRKGNLDDRERREIESHVTHTYRFLEQIPWTRELRRIPEIAYGHHEKLNGTGYPRRVTGTEIPVQTRMMTISDIFDALTATDRPYKRAVPAERALDILSEEAKDGMIDVNLLQTFIEAKIFLALVNGGL